MARSAEGEGVAEARSVRIQRGDPITLTLDASRLDLSREAGEVYSGRNPMMRSKRSR
jgi:hypothetical protein